MIHGFTKKTQKTSKKDLEQGVKNYKDYCVNKKVVDFIFYRKDFDKI